MPRAGDDVHSLVDKMPKLPWSAYVNCSQYAVKASPGRYCPGEADLQQYVDQDCDMIDCNLYTNEEDMHLATYTKQNSSYKHTSILTNLSFCDIDGDYATIPI